MPASEPDLTSAGNEDRPAPLRVLLFEDKADGLIGHFPGWPAALSRLLRGDGHEVHVLTLKGWALAPAGSLPPGVAATHLVAKPFLIAAEAGRHVYEATRLRPGWLWPVTRGADGLRQAALAGGVRHKVRRMGRHEDTVVLSLSTSLQAPWAVLVAAKCSRWCVYAHRGPSTLGPAGDGPNRPGTRLLSALERRRVQAGGHVRVAANNEAAATQWRIRYPWLECSVAPSAGRTPVEARPRHEARRMLGLDPEGPIALVFGDARPQKDLATVFLAFAGDDPPARLVVAGRNAAARLALVRAAHPGAIFDGVIVMDGFQSEERVLLLHSAADYAIFSFSADTTNDSGTLNDAVAHGLPVCCADCGGAAQFVRDYRLGVMFEPGNPESLRLAAKRAALFSLDPRDRHRYLDDHAPEAQARLLLHVGAARTLGPAERASDRHGAL